MRLSYERDSKGIENWKQGENMLEKNVEILINTLLTDCGLGTIISPIESVPGGYLHRMYKVTTDRGIYAVKHLNPEIMSRPDALDNFERAESIEYIPAIVVNENKMQNVRYFADHLDILPGRMFFIENYKGEKVATATAYYDIYGRDNSGDGWLHWVAVRRDYQGKGLSKPLITYALNILHQLGHSIGVSGQAVSE